MLKTILISLALAGVPTISSAEPVHETRAVAVADLDISTPAGKAQLERRIADACGEASSVDLGGRNDVRACRAEALAKATARDELRLARRGTITIASGQQ